MIEYIKDHADRFKVSRSLIITYPRTITIPNGYYPNIAEHENLKLEIKNNISKDTSYATNVKGGMTKWTFFINRPHFSKFLEYVRCHHFVSNPEIFEDFYKKAQIKAAWGNELRKGDSVDVHSHGNFHLILYLTKGSPLILPELNLKITPSPGDYYIFPPEVQHYVEPHPDEDYRYNLICNFDLLPIWGGESS